jgi:hypothetical protein
VTVAELPLNDPRWMPAAEMHRRRWEQVGDPQLAARDLTKAHRSTDKSKRIRSMRRPIYSGVDPDCERLSSSFWIEYEYYWWAPKQALQVRSRDGRRDAIGPDGFIGRASNFAYFGWDPDFDELWWSGAVSTGAAVPIIIEEKKIEQPVSLQRQIAQAIIDRHYPNGVSRTVQTATVWKVVIKTDWRDECHRRKIDPTTVHAPSPNTVKSILGRGKKPD